MRFVTIFTMLLIISKNSFAQSHTKYEIVLDKKGKLSLIDKQNGMVVNKYQKCEVIDSIHNLNLPTNSTYKDYLLIQQGKAFILFNTAENKEIKKLEFDGKFSIHIYEVRNEMNEEYFGRVNPNLIRDYINIHIKGEKSTISLLFNFKTKKFISAMQTYYRSGTFFHLIKEDLILVSTDESKKVIDGNGKLIVPSKTNAFFHNFNGGVAITNENYKYGVVNYQGDTITPFIYEKVHASPKDDFIILENSDRKAGVVNAQGKVLVPFIYKPHHPNYYRNYKYSNYGVFMLYKTNYNDSNFVFVDTNGVELIKEATYQDAWELWLPTKSSYNDRYYFVKKENVGLFDTKQKKEIISCDYSFYKEKDDTKFGVIGAKDVKGNWGLLSLETGAVIIPFEYEPVKSEFIYTTDSVTVYILSKQGKFGVVDLKGNIQLSFDYSNIMKTVVTNLVIVEKDGLYGLFNIKTSEFVLPIEMKAIDKNLKIEKLENGILIKGKFDLKESRVLWQK